MKRWEIIVNSKNMFSWKKKEKKLDKNFSQQGKRKRVSRRVVFGIIFFLILLVVIFFLWAGPTLFKVAPNANVFTSILRSIPGVSDNLKATDKGTTHIVLLGMRGEEVVGGGLLADTIMVASFSQENQQLISLISIPRDLYVTVPESSERTKINAVHALGEGKEKGLGLVYMKKILSEVLGQEIHYAVSIDFAGFEELIDALGGVSITLNEPFIEPIQFHEERVCDPNVFTVPSGNFEEKISGKTGKVKARYPLCYNANEECGGVFQLPAGQNDLDGEKALCYVRSRVTSSDFDRARRQQEVLKQLKEKAFSLGLLIDFEKTNGILNALGNNVHTDLQLWEMKKFFELAKEFQSPEIRQKVLENSEQGLLYTPEDSGGAGYILLPRGDSYTGIHEAFSSLVPIKEEGNK